jgi:hypothetical protein
VNDGDGDYLALYARSEIGSQFTVSSYPAGHASQLQSTVSYLRSGAPEYGMLNAVRLREDEELPQRAQGKLTVSYADAKALADGLLEAAGVDSALLATYLADDAQAGESDGVVRAAEQYAYVFQYERVVSGVPAATDVWEDNTAESALELRENRSHSDNEGSRVLLAERLPYGRNGAAETLLTFPQAKEIFETIAPIAYGAQTSSAIHR